MPKKVLACDLIIISVPSVLAVSVYATLCGEKIG